MRRVLILGDDTRAFLASVRSLGRRGVAVHAVPSDFGSPALRSRYIAQTHFVPAPADGGDEWAAVLDSLFHRIRFDLVMPCSDRWLVPLHTNRGRFEPEVRLAIPAAEHVEVMFDKRRTREVASSLGVPVARAVLPEESVDPATIISRLRMPVVVKPRRSVSPDAARRQMLVELIATEDALRDAVSGRDPATFFCEEFFPGFGVGVSVLADRGEVLLAFQHHRIHQAARGGSSAYRASAPLSPELLDACRKIAGHLGYTGVAMFEFRRNPATQDWILLEINARPWGSMPLPVGLGIEFPYAWYRLLVDGVRPEPARYRAHAFARNLALDVDFALKTIAETRGTLRRMWFLGRWVAGLSRCVVGREKIDSWAADDTGPGFAELRAFASRAGRRALRRVPFSRLVRKHLAHARMRRAIGAPIQRGRTPLIVFVCYGNICRSAFAERALSTALGDSARQARVASAGTYQIGGRHSPAEAVEAAHRHRIDLAPHRSRAVTPQLLDEACLVVAFDRSNIEVLVAQFPGTRCPVMLLGSLVDGDDIVDPYGKGQATFDRVFGLIERGVQVLRQYIVEAIARAPA